MLESSKVWKVESLEDWNNVAAEILKHFPERKIFALYLSLIHISEPTRPY